MLVDRNWKFPSRTTTICIRCWVQKIDGGIFFCWPPNKGPQKSRPIFLERISKFFRSIDVNFFGGSLRDGNLFWNTFHGCCRDFFRPSSSVFRAFAFVASFLRVISIQISLNLIVFAYSQLPGTRARQPWLQMLGTTADLAGQGWKLKGKLDDKSNADISL